MKNAIRAAGVGITLLGAIGCGQKGPLYLPDHAGAVVTRPGTGDATTPPSSPTKKKDSDKDDSSSAPK